MSHADQENPGLQGTQKEFTRVEAIDERSRRLEGLATGAGSDRRQKLRVEPSRFTRVSQ